MDHLKIGIVISRFNDHISDQLLLGATDTLQEKGVLESNIHVYWVPGAFELPLVAQKLAEKKHFDAIICLGSVIRGETSHFDYVAGECARGIQEVSMKYGMPVIFGVLTTENRDQAEARVGLIGDRENKGVYAANAALDMIDLLKGL